MKTPFTDILCWIAGVDRHVLASCPGTDRLWATHLGLSLVLSFLVTFGITYHATSYMIEGALPRLGISAIVALVICLFDRALFQADWFDQGAGQRDARSARVKRALRLGLRLGLSVALAYILSIFLELSIFSGPISEKIYEEYTESNRPVLGRVSEFEESLDEEIRSRRENLVALRADLQSQNPPSLEVANPMRAAIQQRISAAAESRERLQAELSKARAAIAANRQLMAAEEFGQASGDEPRRQPGRGRNYRYAAEQVAIAERDEERLSMELQDLKNQETQAIEELSELDRQGRSDAASARSRDDDWRARILDQIAAEEKATGELEATRTSRIEAFRSTLMQGRDISDFTGDPLARMTAYRKLKEDPDDGATIQIFSWMTKGLIVFLEVMPILAKMVFSPPTVYSLRIRTNVDAEVRQARLNIHPPATDSSDAMRTPDDDLGVRGIAVADKPQLVHPAGTVARRSRALAGSSDDRHE
ncbi:MAG: DUF4407 domain-containing protein [Rhizobiales bacterium]|nr:DUF4407 domain-containing protein [Hyphomicrobiales bacterium]